MDISQSARSAKLGMQILEFMGEHIYPNERRYYDDIEEGDRWQPSKVIEELKPKARAAIASPTLLFLSRKFSSAGRAIDSICAFTSGLLSRPFV